MLTGIEKLTTAGCSFTAGVGLDSTELPWPNLLANKLNLRLTNLAHPGAGNQYIINQVLSQGPDFNSLYIICWSSWSRFDFANNQGKVLHINPNWVNRNELARIIYTDYYNPTYLYKKFLLNVILLQNWFKFNNLQYIMFDAMDNVHPQTDYKDCVDMMRLENQIDREFYIGFQSQSIDRIVHKNKLSDGHPDATGHNLVSEFLYQYITQ